MAINNTITITVFFTITYSESDIIDVSSKKTQRIIANNPFTFAITFIINDFHGFRKKPGISHSGKVFRGIPQPKMTIFLFFSIPAVKSENPLPINNNFID